MIMQMRCQATYIKPETVAHDAIKQIVSAPFPDRLPSGSLANLALTTTGVETGADLWVGLGVHINKLNRTD